MKFLTPNSKHYDNQTINPNKEEIAAYKWMPIQSIDTDLEMHPERYTAWFKEAFDIAKKHIS